MRKTRGLDEHAALQLAVPARELSDEILLLPRIDMVSDESDRSFSPETFMLVYF